MSQIHYDAESTDSGMLSQLNYKVVASLVVIPLLFWVLFDVSHVISAALLFIVVFALALYGRVRNVSEYSDSPLTLQQLRKTDGGCFSMAEKQIPAALKNNVVKDGGSFKRA